MEDGASMEVFKISNIAFMQGRLTKSTDNKLQFFPWKNWIQEFKIASENNFSLIEWTIDSYQIDKNPFFCNKKLVSNLLKENNLQISAVTCDYIMENPFYLKKNNQIDSFEYLKRTIESCIYFDIKYIVFPLVDNGSLKNKPKDTLYNYMQKISDKYTSNISILFEVDLSPNYVYDFIKPMNTNVFGINYDTGNSASLGFDFEEEKNYFNYVKNIHIKDRILYSGSVQLGKGDYDFKKFINFLFSYNYTGNFTLQTAREPFHNDLQNLIENRNFLINLNNYAN